MAKMSRKQVEDIVTKELPGYRVLSTRSDAAADSPDVRRRPEASSPEVDQLMKKFRLDDDDVLADAPAGDTPNGGGSVDDEIALVEKTDPADPLSRANRPKAKVLSPTGTVKGSQG